ncbi:Cytosolic seryl-tRNA synthetase [Chytriomyces hyalinus]|nr:Cytosolic seryl-tRNA synthetase [Chytriomyces hyalinus]
MLDINLFRVEKGGNPELVRESQRRRFASVEVVDEVIAMDNDWKAAKFQADEKNKDINAIQKDITSLMKSGKKDEAQTLLKKKDAMTAEKLELNLIADKKEKLLFAKIATIGNLVHDSCIMSETEDDNEILKKWWPKGEGAEAEALEKEASEKRTEMLKTMKGGHGVPGFFSHHEVLDRLDGYDPDRGNKIAGHRGYFLKDAGLELNLALVQYGLDFLADREFTKLSTPYFMKKEYMAKTAQLDEFDEALYTVKGELGPNGEETDESTKYLIATSEQPISAYHANEWLEESQLPLKYAGFSTCFRKEAGAHGRDNWGIFRVHQFEKIEQFVLTDPEKSWEMHEEMLKNAEDFYKSLGIPFRVVSIVSKALNNAAAKKYDLEAWFPFQGTYKELVSCSNCTDFQTRSLEIRFGGKKMNEVTKRYAHALNCTLTATERTLCCLLENFQTENGVIVPEPLRPYMRGKEFLPFKKVVAAPASSEKAAKGGKNQAKMAHFGPKQKKEDQQMQLACFIALLALLKGAAAHGNHTIVARTIQGLAQTFVGHLEVPNGCGVNADDMPPESPSQNLAALWLRAAFHDVGKFDPEKPEQVVNGLLPNFLTEMENSGIGVSIATSFASYVKFNYSRADFIALAGQAVVIHCGGPTFNFSYGRQDGDRATPFTSLAQSLPDDATHTYDMIKTKLRRLNFTNADIVALVTGSHSLGGAHKLISPHLTDKKFQPFDSTPGVFDNVVFQDALNGKCVTRVDCGIIKDPEMKPLIELYASSQDAFFKQYVESFEKMVNLGQNRTKLSSAALDIEVHEKLAEEGGIQAVLAAADAASGSKDKVNTVASTSKSGAKGTVVGGLMFLISFMMLA